MTREGHYRILIQ